MIIELARGIRVDIDRPQENLEEIVMKEFGEYTKGTSHEYTYEDRLMFIDNCLDRLHHALDPAEIVNNLCVEMFEYNLREVGHLMDPDEFMDSCFLEACINEGISRHRLRSNDYAEDRHDNEKIMKILVRVINAVFSWQPPLLPREETITFTMDDASMQNFLKIMEQLDAEDRRRMFEPGNRIDLICGDKKITYVAEGWSDADLP